MTGACFLLIPSFCILLSVILHPRFSTSVSVKTSNTLTKTFDSPKLSMHKSNFTKPQLRHLLHFEIQSKRNKVSFPYDWSKTRNERSMKIQGCKRASRFPKNHQNFPSAVDRRGYDNKGSTGSGSPGVKLASDSSSNLRDEKINESRSTSDRKRKDEGSAKVDESRVKRMSQNQRDSRRFGTGSCESQKNQANNSVKDKETSKDADPSSESKLSDSESLEEQKLQEEEGIARDFPPFEEAFKRKTGSPSKREIADAGEKEEDADAEAEEEEEEEEEEEYEDEKNTNSKFQGKGDDSPGNSGEKGKVEVDENVKALKKEAELSKGRKRKETLGRESLNQVPAGEKSSISRERDENSEKQKIAFSGNSPKRGTRVAKESKVSQETQKLRVGKNVPEETSVSLETTENIKRLGLESKLGEKDSENEKEEAYEKMAVERIQRKIDALKEQIKREIEEEQRIREIEMNNEKFDEIADDEGEDEEEDADDWTDKNTIQEKTETHESKRETTNQREKRKSKEGASVTRNVETEGNSKKVSFPSGFAIPIEEREIGRKIIFVNKNRLRRNSNVLKNRGNFEKKFLVDSRSDLTKYRPEILEEDGDVNEGNEFNDDGFDDRTAKLINGRRSLKSIGIGPSLMENRNFLFDQKHLFRMKRNRRRSAIPSRKSSKFRNKRERRKKGHGAVKQTAKGKYKKKRKIKKSKPIISLENITKDSTSELANKYKDAFGGFPTDSKGALTRSKRVKRVLKNA